MQMCFKEMINYQYVDWILLIRRMFLFIEIRLTLMKEFKHLNDKFKNLFFWNREKLGKKVFCWTKYMKKLSTIRKVKFCKTEEQSTFGLKKYYKGIKRWYTRRNTINIFFWNRVLFTKEARVISLDKQSIFSY